MKRMWSKNELRKIIQETYGIDFNNLIDKDGHSRFIEGDIDIKEIAGVTKTYGKWSLSGSHLLIVLALDIANTTAISAATVLAELNLPDWVKSKIVALFSTYWVINNTYSAYGDDFSSESFGVGMTKSTKVEITTFGSFTATKNRHVRLNFDLLIDNE